MSGKTPTHHAAFTGNELFIVYAAAFGAEINARDNEGKTPLILSCKSYVEHKNIECLKKLLLGGADKYLRDSQNYSAIDYLKEIEANSGMRDKSLIEAIGILNDKLSFLQIMGIKGSYAK